MSRTTTKPAKKKYGKLDKKLMFIGILFLMPATILVAFTTIIPVVWNIVLSLCKWNGNGPMEFVGLENFTKLFTDTPTLKTIGNSLFIAGVSTIFTMVLGILLALMIYKTGKKEGAFFRFVFYNPNIMPMTVAGLLFVFVLAPDEGLLNNIFAAMGLESLQHAWLAEPGLVLWTLAIVAGWKGSGCIMMLIYTGVLAIPDSLFESAKLDGANYFKEVRMIILPLIKPTICMVFSMEVMWSFKTYDIVWTMTQGGPGSLSKTAPISMIQQAFTYNKFGYASAIGLVFSVIVLICIGVVRRMLRSETYEY
ncbi:carbohydrate ABC transporter permease [Cuneatibacter caecimuris]|uniref:Carbohydrate ABC transporter membrane protein 1 (CUT1 family) n=1 Tax=Cuneatibacter caecimuris TaxID=1796618 RepID=A0A4Q7PRJ9_9FIRM|nr:sugar ABC transporter permease [Cuneatibacter caecimuris]RZT02976.1 carbohydrate ABC transporter membrane protein 1 (CUT1 family) [Cuneatibacter caecimuris]